MKKLLLMACIGCSLSATAQETSTSTTRGVGIRVNVQTTHSDFQIPIWVTKKMTLAPTFGVTSVANNTDILFGLTPRFYFKDPVTFAPYLGATVAAVTGDGVTDLLGGLSFGGEYFFNRHFSVSAEIQGNVISSDDKSLRFGNPGETTFNTGSALSATIYF